MYWKGHLKLSLVSCPIALYPAISAADRVTFRQVNRRTGNRLRHKLVDAVTGEGVDAADKGRGYEIGEHQFLLVDDHELERARQERPQPGALPMLDTPSRRSVEQRPELVAQPNSGEAESFEDNIPIPPRPQKTHTIEIERFVPQGQIDARYFEKPYYIVPRELVGQEAYAVNPRCHAGQGGSRAWSRGAFVT